MAAGAVFTLCLGPVAEPAGPSRRPGRDDLMAAAGRTVPDVIAPRLEVVFCGINPGLYSAAVGHHFARPGNRFWKALEASGFTPRLFQPSEERQLLRLGLGITNLVTRSTAGAADLSAEELRQGADELRGRLQRSEPRFVAFLGMSAYRTAFGRPRAALGEQSERLARSRVWLLPNPSGAQARYQLPELIAEFSRLREAVRKAPRQTRGRTRSS
jgi:TDG/mug DNA glycosylase family protein